MFLVGRDRGCFFVTTANCGVKAVCVRFANWTPRPKIIFRESEPNFFDLLHSSWAQKHCSTYKLVWKSMKPNREICVIAHRAITERIALLDSRIMLFKAYEGKMAISACCMACRHIDMQNMYNSS